MKVPVFPLVALFAVAELPDLSTVMQFGALGVMAVYFLYVQPRVHAADREARKQELETAHKQRMEELRFLAEALRPRGGGN